MVITLSDSFASAWQDLADEAGARLTTVGPEDEWPSHPGMVVVSAGGEEERALDLLPSLRSRATAPIVVVGGRPSHRFAVEAIRRGAADYVVFPEDVGLFRRLLQARTDAARQRVSGAHEVPGEADPFHDLVGESEALRAMLRNAQRILRHKDVTVLIGGETGTGKELLARALHDGGPRAAQPFVAVNCAAIPSQLLESELFGHERGAFTDAHRAKAGLFEEADKGTLFLDEIGHLPLPLQGKLLRALDNRQVRRVGATQPRTIDVRIIAATHVDLRDAVKQGEFREDLFYRLNVVSLTLPPLRERGDDVLLLARVFAESVASRYDLHTPPMTTAVQDALRRHAWPGNVRELRHAVERSLLLSEPGTWDPEQLAPQAPADRPASATLPFPASLDSIEAAAARAAVEHADGNKSAAARQLGISRSRLQRLLDLGDSLHDHA